ncbi:MAG: response regulator transcription factor [Bacillota bacterium]|nr:response regulator transcription factor [Bacillota bacterium]
MSQTKASSDSATILVVDDDREIVEALSIYLHEAGYTVRRAHTGREALEQLDTENIDLVLLDIMMPELDGIRATQRIRDSYNLPIILISAKSEDQDKIFGLSVGADDYITKPFNPQEVIARVRAQLRRYTVLGTRPDDDRVYTSGGLVLDDRAKTCTIDGEEVRLTQSEYRILAFLMQNKGRVFSTSAIYEAVWKTESMGSENVVSVHVFHIREKIEPNPRNPIYLKVFWGRGYMIEDLDPKPGEDGT